MICPVLGTEIFAHTLDTCPACLRRDRDRYREALEEILRLARDEGDGGERYENVAKPALDDPER